MKSKEIVLKILAVLIAVLSIPVSLFTSASFWMSLELDLAGTGFGVAVCVAGSFAVIVSVVCTVLCVIKVCKGKLKPAFVFALGGFVYCAIVFGGLFIDDAMHEKRLEESIAERNKETYGEDWDAPSNIEGIPEKYEEELNKLYVAVRDRWSADELIILGAITMADYYGDASTDNIGFTLMDLNSDGVDELLIGTVASAGEATTVLVVYSDPENPFLNLSAVEGQIYYLHAGETEGAFVAEIGGDGGAWILSATEGECIVEIDYQEGAMDPAGRLTLEMIPFSQYK